MRQSAAFGRDKRHAVHRHCHHRRGTCRLDRRRNARPRRHFDRADRSACDLSGRFSRRKTQRSHPGRAIPADRNRRLSAAPRDFCRRELDRAIRSPARQGAEPAVQYPLRFPGQRDPRRDSRECRARLGQGGVDRNEPGAAENHARQRHDGLGPPDRARQRIERRSAPPARHHAQGHQRLPFDLDRVRHRAGGADLIQFSGADLFLGAAERPHPLHHAVSDRHADARQFVRLPRLRRSLAARAAPRAGGDAGRRPAAAEAHHRPLRRRRRDEDPPGRSLCERRQPSARPGAGGRRLLDLVPGRRHRLRQGVHRRRAALQRLRPAVAGFRRDGRGQARHLLRRSGQAGLR